MTDFHSYDPATGHGLPHDPFKAIVAPRPVGWISSVDAGGRPNLAPYSFFNAFSGNPPIIGFSSEGAKHSHDNIAATGVFCFNLATLELAQAMNQTSAVYPAGVNEFEMAGLEALACEVIAVPRVAASPAALECRLTQIHRLRDMHGAETDNYLVLGQVVRVHIDRRVLRDGLYDITATKPIARCGYRGDFAVVTETFEMLRPRV
jgi:flavin reductase (DIM6/NTAB) family NADH-FMN oxidoreductase RutF